MKLNYVEEASTHGISTGEVTTLFVRTAFILAAALLLCAHSVPARAGAGETVVGSFEIQVQIQQRRVTVRDLGGSHAAALPSTALSAEFLSWDADDERAEISVAVKNIGAASLFGPLEARVVKLASPFTAAVAPDFVTGWSYDGADLGGLPFLPAGATSEARTWSFVSPHARAFKLDVEVVARVPHAPGAGRLRSSQERSTIAVRSARTRSMSDRGFAGRLLHSQDRHVTLTQQ